MKQMKGQITVFMLLVIILVVILFLFGFMTNVQLPALPENEVSSFVASCLHESASKAVRIVGAGRERVQLNAIPPIIVPQDVETEISKKTEALLPRCYENFSKFPQYTVQVGQPQVSAVISKEMVSITLNQAVKVFSGEAQRNLQQFTNSIQTDLLDVINTANAFHKKNDLVPMRSTKLNATIFSKDSRAYIVYDFSMKDYPYPVQWWERLT